jgi:hypothetical protein
MSGWCGLPFFGEYSRLKRWEIEIEHERGDVASGGVDRRASRPILGVKSRLSGIIFHLHLEAIRARRESPFSDAHCSGVPCYLPDLPPSSGKLRFIFGEP